MERMKLIKRFSKIKLRRDFDQRYDEVKKIALDIHSYDGEIIIVKNKKSISFYILNDIENEMDLDDDNDIENNLFD